MPVLKPGNCSPVRPTTPARCRSPGGLSLERDSCRIVLLIAVCLAILPSVASATGYELTAASMDRFANGISYHGQDSLIITIQDNVTIQSTGSSGIESSAPVTIRSPAGKTLTIAVDNDSVLLYGIKAPAVSLESGTLAITVNGRNDKEKGNAFGIWAGQGNVTISGGSVFTNVETTGHKNKGIYALRYIVVTGGRVTADQRGGMNTFGLDGGDVETGTGDGGIVINGGIVSVNSTGGGNRNLGIDSKFGTVRISGNPVVFISQDGSGARQNWAYNASITTFAGTNAVVFASEGENYRLCRSAVLARNATLVPGRTFEIPAGMDLEISDGTGLVKPAGTPLNFGSGYGTFGYDRVIYGENGAAIYTGRVPVQRAPGPLAGLFAGLCIAAALLIRRK